MATSTAALDTADKLISVAKALRDTANSMDARRWQEFSTGKMTEEEFRSSVARGSFLRRQIDEILVKAMKTVIDGVQEDQTALEDAIQKAKKAIKSIADIKKALTVFATVVGLAEAIAVGSPQGIVEGLLGVKSAVSGS